MLPVDMSSLCLEMSLLVGHRRICSLMTEPQKYGEKSIKKRKTSKWALVTLWHRNHEIPNGSVSCGGASCITQWLFQSSFLLPGGCQGSSCWVRRECGRSLQPSLLWRERLAQQSILWAAKIVFPLQRCCCAFLNLTPTKCFWSSFLWAAGI